MIIDNCHSESESEPEPINMSEPINENPNIEYERLFNLCNQAITARDFGEPIPEDNPYADLSTEELDDELMRLHYRLQD